MNRVLAPSVARQTMRGAITTRDVLLHSATILRLWGPAAYLHCLRAALSREPTTFLSVLQRCGALGARSSRA